jgi:hypothetical protein
VAARRTLFKYYSDRQWAEGFVEGRMRFWSLGHFRDLEEQGVRGDANEGAGIFAPAGGLDVTNHTQGTRFMMPDHELRSRAQGEDIFVLCASRPLSHQLWRGFGAVVCIEVVDIPAFCKRVAAALPAGAVFPGVPGRERIGWRVDYYNPEESGPRWALPDRIAYSKLRAFKWQDEFRLVFSTSGALAFQNVALTLQRRYAPPAPAGVAHAFRDIAVGSLRDICRIHERPA